MCLREVAVVLHTQRFSQSWKGDFTNKDSGSYPGTTGWTRILFILAQEQISRVVSCWEGEGYPDLHALSWPLIAESQARVHNISLVELSSWKLGRCLSASLPSASVLWQKETALGAPGIQHSYLANSGGFLPGSAAQPCHVLAWGRAGAVQGWVRSCPVLSACGCTAVPDWHHNALLPRHQPQHRDQLALAENGLASQTESDTTHWTTGLHQRGEKRLN